MRRHGAGSRERIESDVRPRELSGAYPGGGTIASTPGSVRRLVTRCGRIGPTGEKIKPRQHPERGSRAKGRRARRTRGRVRIRRTGLQRRARSPSVRSSVRGARSRIARFGRARIPTSRPAPVSPVFPLAWAENAQRRGSANGRSKEARAHLCGLKDRRRSREYSRVVTRASRSRKTGALPSTACVEAPLGSV